MTHVIKAEQYWQIVGRYLVACESQREVRRQEMAIAQLLGDATASDILTDSIYDPTKLGNKSELDKILYNAGVMIEWKESKKEKPKEDDVSR